MAKKTIWDLSLEISGKGTEASQAIRTVKKQLEDLKGAADQAGKDWKNFTGNATKLALGVAGGVAAATAGVVSMANSFAEAGDKAAKTSAAIGIGIEAYQELQYAMGQSGVSAEEFNGALQKFNLTVKQGAAGNEAMWKQIDAIGLSANKLAGMKPEQAMMKLSDYMKSLPNDAARTQAAVTLFGKTAGPKMMAAMKQGSAGIKELMSNARDLGIVISEEQARQSEAYGDALDDLKQSVTGFKNQFIGSAIGPLTEAFTHLKDAIVEQMPVIREVGKMFGQWLGDLVKRLPEIIAKIKEFGSWVKNTVTGIKDFVGGWKNLAKILAGLAIAPTFISGLKVVFSFGKLISIAMKNLPLIMAKMGFAAVPITSALLPIIGIIAGIAAAATAAFLIFKNWEKIKSWLQENKDALTLVGIAVGTLTVAIVAYNAAQAIMAAGGIKAVAAMAAQAISTNALTIATGAWAVASKIAAIGTTAFGAAMSFLTSPITLVILAIGALIAAAYLIIKNWDVVSEFFTGLWEKIKNVFSGVIDWVKTNWQSIVAFLINPFAGVFKYFYDNFEGFRNLVDNVVGAISNFFKGGGEAIFGFFNTAFDNIKSAFEGVINFFKGGVETIKNFFGGIGSAISGLFGGDRNNKNNALPGHAEGGIFRQRHIAEIAERGAEAIVPLNNTSQGFDIWKQAGALGGYLKKAAEQSLAISAAAPVTAAATSGKIPEPSPVMAAAAQKISSGDTVIKVDFKMTNNFNSGTPDAETSRQISEAGQKAGDDFESRVKSALESIMRNQYRVSYA